VVCGCRCPRLHCAQALILPRLSHAGGTLIGLHGIARDITSAKKVESALRESEERARAIIRASPVPMATNDASQRVTFTNPAFTRTFGYDLSDIPTLADWWPKAYPDPAYRQWVLDTRQAELVRSDREGTPFAPLEFVIRCKDGIAHDFRVLPGFPADPSRHPGGAGVGLRRRSADVVGKPFSMQELGSTLARVMAGARR